MVKRRILEVITDILERGNLTTADRFIVEILLAQGELVARVSGNVLHIYNEKETELDCIEFLRQYKKQIKETKVE